MTDATSYQDCATLHRLLLQVDMGGWGILPLQYARDDWYASVKERNRWCTFQKWACNDLAPGICSTDTHPKSRSWSNQRVVAILQGMKDAKAIRDFAWVRWLQQNLRQLASPLSIPLYVCWYRSFPNLRPTHKSAIHHVCRKMVWAQS